MLGLSCVLLIGLGPLAQVALGVQTELTPAWTADIGKVRNTAVTDAGLDHLAEIPSLKHIILERSKITAAGIAKFKKKRPDCHASLHVPL